MDEQVLLISLKDELIPGKAVRSTVVSVYLNGVSSLRSNPKKNFIAVLDGFTETYRLQNVLNQNH